MEYPKSGSISGLGEAALFEQLKSSVDITCCFSETRSQFPNADYRHLVSIKLKFHLPMSQDGICKLLKLLFSHFGVRP